MRVLFCLSIAIFLGSLCGAKGGCVRLAPDTGSKKISIPISDPEKIARASWYGPGFFGHRLASGKRYRKDAVFVAHRYYPMGTKVRITNLGNKRTIVVEVADRGPYVAGRSFDLSYQAARDLEIISTGTVLVAYRVIP